MELQRGQKTALSHSAQVELTIEIKNNPFVVDLSCMGVNAQNKLVNDDYMIFYNQTSTPAQDIVMTERGTGDNRITSFTLKLDSLRADVEKVVVCAAIEAGSGHTMRELGLLKMSTPVGSFSLTGADFSQEKAVIIAELYKKEGMWRLGCVGQGFNGGLDALVKHFGAQVAEEANSSTTAAASNSSSKTAVFLSKRVDLEKKISAQAPQLVSLAKKASVSLEKRGLGEHQAKVALCLDISASMASMYRSGLVQKFVERILALGCRLDDDGSIDIFLFGQNGYQPQPITVNDFQNYVSNMLRQYPLEGDTKYSTAIELVRKFYSPSYQYERSEPARHDLPVYVMFLTDGQPSDKAQATRALKNASYEPIFWQFMGVGNADFSYLEKLDDLSGRFVDNADFFSIQSLNALSDEALYDKLMNEYPAWLKIARQKGMI